MFGPKLIFIFGIFSAIFVVKSLACGCNQPCEIKYKCSDNEKVVWTTDGTSCYVNRNLCHLKKVNCDRKNNYMEPLTIVCKDECQKLCRKICTLELRPVCGIYNGIKRTFSNRCMMDSHICRTGETYTLYSNGECC